MEIKRVRLENFRNISNIDIEPSENVNVIFGENGQGKTNLIEGMWMCTGMKSFRNATQSQLINFESDFARVNLDYFAFRRNQNIDLKYQRRENKKEIRLNGVEIKSGTEFSGNFCACVFSPTHLELITGSPELRRRFIDTTISQIRPHYDDLLLKYHKSLNQRNHMLRGFKGNKKDKDLLYVWNESLVGFGASIMEYRYHFLSTLREKAAFYYDSISSSREKLSIKYRPSVKFDMKDFKIHDISDVYRKKLEESFENDINSGFTNYGVHRDDVDFIMNGHSAKNFASQGQKRSIVLSLKLGESDILRESTGEEPVIFLDDIMSELDEQRGNYILNYIENKQVFITCCDKSMFELGKRGKVFEVKNGTIV